jgi:hypothetical protein
MPFLELPLFWPKVYAMTYGATLADNMKQNRHFDATYLHVMLPSEDM